MPDEMGTFRVDIQIENPARPGERRTVGSALVDTGAELTWVPAALLESLGIERYGRLRFRQATGTVVERWTGAAFIHVAGRRTADDVGHGTSMRPGPGLRKRHSKKPSAGVPGGGRHSVVRG